MPTPRSIAIPVLALMCLGWGRPAWAQFSSGSSSMFGSSSGSMSGQSSGFGGGSMSGMGGGFGTSGGGMGMSGAGMGMMGTGTQGMSMPMTAAQRLAQGQQAGGFVGTTAQQMQQNFAGVAQATQAGSAGSFNPLGGSSGAMGGMGGMAGMQQRPGGSGFGGAQGGRSQPAIRCMLAVGFDLPEHQSAALSTDLAGLLSRAAAIRARKPLQVLLEGRTAILRGEVATEHGRELAGQLARLEGGIDQVRNEIVVAGSTTGSSSAGAMQEGRPLAGPEVKPARPGPSATSREAAASLLGRNPAAPPTGQAPMSSTFQAFPRGRLPAWAEKSPGGHTGPGKPAGSATQPAGSATPPERR